MSVICDGGAIPGQLETISNGSEGGWFGAGDQGCFRKAFRKKSQRVFARF